MKIEVVRTESGQDVPEVHVISMAKSKTAKCADSYTGARLTRVGSVRFSGRLGIFAPPPPCSGMCGRIIVQGKPLPDPNVFY
jgi:hypothetical protein